MPSLLLVIAAPSGAGKSTLCDRLLAEFDSIVYSVSCTTRSPRGNEIDGKDYHFITDSQFDSRLAHGEFLEHAVVHGHRYGTLTSQVESVLSAGKDVVMDIDVQGACQVRTILAESTDDSILKAALVDIFVEPPSADVLAQRLGDRHEDSEDAITERLSNAVVEMAHADEFRHRIVNDDLETAYSELVSIIDRARAV